MKPLTERMIKAILDADLHEGRLRLQRGTRLGTIVGLIHRGLVGTVRSSRERHPLTVEGAALRIQLRNDSHDEDLDCEQLGDPDYEYDLAMDRQLGV